MDLGPHASFIWMAYAITALVIASLIGWLLADGKRLRAALKDLDARGVKRRSALDSNQGSAGNSV